MSHSSFPRRSTPGTTRGRLAVTTVLALLAIGAQPTAQASQVTGTGISSVITKTPPPHASAKATAKPTRPADGAAGAKSKRGASGKS